MDKKSGSPPVKGYRSSLIASLIALSILLVPFLVGNFIQKARSGEGKYEFDEEICWDITKEQDFNMGWSGFNGGTGSGALVYRYYIPGITYHHSGINIFSLPLNGTVDNYCVGSVQVNPGDVQQAVVAKAPILFFCMNFTKKKLLDLDITSFEIYLDIVGSPFLTVGVSITDESESNSINFGTVSLGNKTRVTVSVGDLLGINTLTDNEKIIFVISGPTNIIIPDNAPIIFDWQWYCIKEIKIPTLTKLGIYMSFTGIGLIFLGFIVAPEYTFEGVIDGILKLFRR